MVTAKVKLEVKVTYLRVWSSRNWLGALMWMEHLRGAILSKTLKIEGVVLLVS